VTSNGPESPAATEWDAALRRAFEILLGGSAAGDPASRYGVYHASDPFNEGLFPGGWATADSLADPDPQDLPGFEMDSSGSGDAYPIGDPPAGWRFELSESLFRFSDDLLDGTGRWVDGKLGPSPFLGGFAADLRAASVSGRSDGVLVRGADLAPLLGRHGVSLADDSAGRLRSWLSVVLRVATDGTLTGAMRAATFTGNGPGHLIPAEAAYGRLAAPEWEEALSRVGHPGLRDHLRLLSLSEEDSRGDGASYFGSRYWPFWADDLKAAGCSLVAGWGYGEGQAGTAVVRLPGELRSHAWRLAAGTDRP
jgi:hypothetical protein